MSEPPDPLVSPTSSLGMFSDKSVNEAHASAFGLRDKLLSSDLFRNKLSRQSVLLQERLPLSAMFR
jgi:hypothetical protein